MAAFAAAYPKSSRSTATRRAFLDARKGATADEIIKGARHYARQCEGREPRFIADAANWLRDERWKDVAEPEILVDPGIGRASAPRDGGGKGIDYIQLAMQRIAERRAAEAAGEVF